MDLARRLWRSKPHKARTEQPLPQSLEGLSARNYDLVAGSRSSNLASRLPSQRSGWKVLVALVLVTGLAVSAVSASAWYAYVSSLRRQAVTSSLGNVRSILGTSLERDNDLLATVNTLVATHPELTNASLVTFLARLDLSQAYPGSIAFTYVESVSSAGLARFEALTRRDPPLGVAAASSVPVTRSLNGRPGYCLTRLAAVELLPSQEILKYLLLHWVSPYLSAHFNFCYSSFEELLDTAAATGRPSVESVISLLQPPPGLPAIPGALHAFVAQLPIFAEVSPVYTGAGPPPARAGPRHWLAGLWASSTPARSSTLRWPTRRTSPWCSLMARWEPSRRSWPVPAGPRRG